MIEVENLTKRYREKLAVDGLDFVVQPGMIAGLDEPIEGRGRVNGRDYCAASAPMAELDIWLEAKAMHTGRTARNHLLALAQTFGVSWSRVDELIDWRAGASPPGSPGPARPPSSPTAAWSPHCSPPSSAWARSSATRWARSSRSSLCCESPNRSWGDPPPRHHSPALRPRRRGRRYYPQHRLPGQRPPAQPAAALVLAGHATTAPLVGAALLSRRDIT